MSTGPTNDGLDESLRPIAQLCDGKVSFQTDGWRKLIHMAKLRFRVGSSSHVMDAVLCLNYDNPSYPTKLYLAENVGGEGLNWNEQAYLLGRNWQTFSWKDVPADQPYVDILASHLSALSKGKAA
ncbi:MULTISPECIES: hypothetical protein [unclassified Bradyrhizobium]|uniref:hypothetical protein n=1 Tax=unclassified Bradyrhizobium TaxID=2631580 RepID=UPI001FFB908C|nr:MULTISPECIES: hypothetical protein [unclassified Bradyrhizobium]MCK1415322.1 hypothetical protein [Bradyrhizobium sp. CW4]UPJ26562.1 hypothetical protein IVB54_33635 [Bradyrhizobium sp. CW1]